MSEWSKSWVSALTHSSLLSTDLIWALRNKVSPFSIILLLWKQIILKPESFSGNSLFTRFFPLAEASHFSPPWCRSLPKHDEAGLSLSMVSVWVPHGVNRQARGRTGRRKESFMQSRAEATWRDDKLRHNWLAKHLKDKAVTSLQTPHSRVEGGDKEKNR